MPDYLGPQVLLTRGRADVRKERFSNVLCVAVEGASAASWNPGCAPGMLLQVV